MIFEKRNISIAILLATFNRYAVTSRCITAIENLQAISGVRTQIYLTDDNSPDQTGILIKKQFPHVKVFHSNGSLYWNRGMINSWEESIKDSPDFFLLLNDDVALRADALIQMYKMYLENLPDTVIVGRTYFGDPLNITYGGLEKKSVFSKFAFKISPVESKSVCTFNANCVLIPSHAVDAVGILDPYYSQQFGDIDLGLRFRKKGWGIVQAPRPVAELSKNLSYPHGSVKMNLSSIKFLLTNPKGMPYRETWHFYKKFGGVEFPLYFLFRYFKILFTRIYSSSD